MRLLAALIAWIAAIATAAAVSSAVAGSIHTTSTSGTAGASETGSTGTPVAPTPTAPFDPSSVKAANPDSLFLGANFAHVLSLARNHLGAHARLESSVIQPGQLLLMADRGGRVINAIVRINGDYLASDGGPVIGTTPAFTLSELGAGVPATLASRLAARGHVPTSQIQYLVGKLDPVSGRFAWYVYTSRSGIYFKASGARSPITEQGGLHAITIR